MPIRTGTIAPAPGQMQTFYTPSGHTLRFNTGQDKAQQLELWSERMDPLSDIDSLSPSSKENDLSIPEMEDLEDGSPDSSTGQSSLPAEDASSWASAYSPREKVWLGGLALAILLVAIFALTLFFGNITTSSGEDVDFPVEGKHLTIRNIETYWRKVDPESDSGVQLDTKFIPAAEITLDSSGSGFLRFLFENPQGDLIGDSVTLVIRSGNFEENNQKTATINATGGFKDLGDYNEYLTEQVRFWKLVVLEGGTDSEDQAFNSLLRMPISPKRR